MQRGIIFLMYIVVVSLLALAAIVDGGPPAQGNRVTRLEIHRRVSVPLDEAGYGLIRFEGDAEGGPPAADDGPGQYGLISFESQTANQPFKFQNDDGPNDVGLAGGNSSDDDLRLDTGGRVTFQDENALDPGTDQVNSQPVNKKKKRRRRRKPRQQQLARPGPYPGLRPGPLPPPGTSQGQYPFVNPAYPMGHPFGQIHRPRRPKPTGATAALSAAVDALSSIARYDDAQCVPRLLCEAAGARAAAASAAPAAPASPAHAALTQAATTLQPLLTLLAAYRGVSSSPLLVFGRAVLLGMAARDGPAPCGYAYPLCPSDPEQLVHYLNNHNGGFFRFFAAPQTPNTQQDLQQFYNQLAVPGHAADGNYGFYQPPNFNQPPAQAPYSTGQHNYGLYQNLLNQAPQNYAPTPGSYGLQNNYGFGYPYSQDNFSFYQNNYKNNNNTSGKEIEKRIQNTKSYYSPYSDAVQSGAEDQPKWSFPGDNSIYDRMQYKRHNHFRFPEGGVVKLSEDTKDEADKNRQAKGFFFPGAQTNRQYPDEDELVAEVDDGPQDPTNAVEVVYVVRGDGDPNHPEVVYLRPGQRIV